MDITIYDSIGLPRGCDTGGCLNKATSAWSATVMAGGASGSQRYACHEHNPMRYTTAVLPPGFTSQPLCHACGQPVRFGSLTVTS